MNLFNSLTHSTARYFGRELGKQIIKNISIDDNIDEEIDLSAYNDALTDEQVSELWNTNIDDWCNKYNCTISTIGCSEYTLWNTIKILLFVGSFFVCPFTIFYMMYKSYKHLHLTDNKNYKRYVIRHVYIDEYNVIDNRKKSGFATKKRQLVQTFILPVDAESYDKWVKKELKVGKIYGMIAYFPFVCIALSIIFGIICAAFKGVF